MTRQNKTRKIWVWGSVSLLSILSVFLFGQSIHATITTLYAGDCVGGWENVNNATGTANLALDASPYDFNETNSAVVGDIISDITCSNFVGEIPLDSLPKKLTLNLYWATKIPVQVTDVSVSSSSITASTIDHQVLDGVATSVSDTTASSSVDDGIASSSDSELNLSELIPNTASVYESIERDVPVEIPTEVTPAVDQFENNTEQNLYILEEEEPETYSESSVQSFLNRITPSVFAEEIVSATTTSIEGESVIAITSTQGVLADPFLKVEYSLDNTVWHELGVVGIETFTHTFELPLGDISSWDMLRNIKIRISRLTTFNIEPSVYLDAMALTVDYSSYADLKVKPVELSNSNPSFALSLTDKTIPNVTLSGKTTGVAVYKNNASTSVLLFTTSLDQNPIDFDVEDWTPFTGYTFVSTNDVNWCSDKNLNECITDDNFQSTSTFRVIPR